MHALIITGWPMAPLCLALRYPEQFTQRVDSEVWNSRRQMHWPFSSSPQPCCLHPGLRCPDDVSLGMITNEENTRRCDVEAGGRRKKDRRIGFADADDVGDDDARGPVRQIEPLHLVELTHRAIGNDSPRDAGPVKGIN